MALGSKFASILKPGDVVEFIGDLGGGKTTFIKGLAKGLGIEQTVTSPTYNIQRSYKIPSGGTLEHYDLYRLGDDKVLLQEMKEIIAAQDAIIVIEWADHFTQHLTQDRFVIKAEYIDEQTRRYELIATGESTAARLSTIKARLERLFNDSCIAYG